MPEGRGIFPNLSVRENLLMATQVGVPMEPRSRTWPSPSSRGSAEQAQAAGRHALGRGAADAGAGPGVRHRPEAPPARRALARAWPRSSSSELYEKVAELASGGLSILLVEQFARTALPIADAAAVVFQGVIASQGSPAEMEEALSASYLGG